MDGPGPAEASMLEDGPADGSTDRSTEGSAEALGISKDNNDSRVGSSVGCSELD